MSHTTHPALLSHSLAGWRRKSSFFSHSPVVIGSDKLKESYRCEYTYYKGQGNKGCKEQKKKSTTQRIKTIGLRSSGEIRIVRVSPDDVAISGVIP